MSRSATAPHTSSSRSARVDLPWSMWAIMLKLRIFSCFTIVSPRFIAGAAGGGYLFAALTGGGGSYSEDILL